MNAYYNELAPFPAEWLRNRVAEGSLPPGHVDERSIADVQPDALADYTQCHFFAGVGGWPDALALAGWSADRPVWTGSCPCQPFSCAGARRGEDDPRHLWPQFRRLIAECRPPTIFGEQVASRDGRQWLARVRADLEALGYAVGSADLCAAGAGAPHIRQRLFWVADTKRDAGCAEHVHEPRRGRSQGPKHSAVMSGPRCELADLCSPRHPRRTLESTRQKRQAPERSGDADKPRVCPDCCHAAIRAGICDPGQLCPACLDSRELVNTQCPGVGWRNQRESETQRPEVCQCGDGASVAVESRDGSEDAPRPHGENSPWDDFDLIPCIDRDPDSGAARVRRVEPGTFPLVNGIPARTGPLLARMESLGIPTNIGRRIVKHAKSNRVGRLCGYGNAIVPQVAARVIRAFLEGDR